MTTIHRQLRELLVRVTGSVEVTDLDGGRDLFGAGVLDSFGIIAVIGALEDDLGIVVPDDELVPDNFWSLDALAALVVRLGEGAPA